MNPIRTLSSVLLLASLSAPAFAADHTPEELATWHKAADNRIRAQQIVNLTLAAHPELIVIGLHATAPGAAQETMIATNLDRVGKLDDDDDKAAVIEHKIVLAPNPTDPNKFEVQISLHDAAGRLLPAGAGLVFKYQPGDDPVRILANAVQIRNEMAKQIPDFASLFAPIK